MRKQALAKIDMTIQNERGGRTRFLCESVTDFQVKAYKHVLDVWRSKAEPFRSALIKETTAKLKFFDLNSNSSFTIGGLVFMPTVDFASS